MEYHHCTAVFEAAKPWFERHVYPACLRLCGTVCVCGQTSQPTVDTVCCTTRSRAAVVAHRRLLQTPLLRGCVGMHPYLRRQSCVLTPNAALLPLAKHEARTETRDSFKRHQLGSSEELPRNILALRHALMSAVSSAVCMA